MESVPSCPYKTMCDAALASWTDAVSNDQFKDDAIDSCVRLDLAEDGEILPDPVTGRNTHNTALDNCKWKAVDQSMSGEWEENPQTHSEYLADTGCIEVADKDKCLVEMESYGVSYPDSSTDGLTDPRMQAEICATNMLHDDQKQFTADHPQTGWHFLGLQETGLYRTSPSLYQCRTENQCSGCSDPRFRGWYASAASGPKDVVIVLDVSGSMNDLDRLAKAKVAAKWTINTLTEQDHATVVSYASNADSASATLIPMTPVNRAMLKEYIDDLGAFGSTNMHDGLSLAFDVIDASVAAGVTTGC